MSLAISPVRPASNGARRRVAADILRRAAEGICSLPVAAIWFFLYRWSPNPP